MKSSNQSQSSLETSKRKISASASPETAAASTNKKNLFQWLSTNLKRAWQGDQPLSKKTSFWLGVTTGVTLGGTSALVGYVWYRLESNLPANIEDILTYAPAGTMTIEAADGSILQEIGTTSHEQLKIWQIPTQVQQAFLASEDRRFYAHKGVDFQGIARAIVANIKAKGVVEGGSTITQQLARIAFLNQEKSIWRKIKEMHIAQKIEATIPKEKILEKYLNSVYLGSGAYGIADAAWVYYGKSVADLNLSEIATLAGIIPAPSIYSPLQNPQLAKQRRDGVIRRMLAEGLIDEPTAQATIASEIKTNHRPLKRLEVKYPYFTQYVREELSQLLPEKTLNQGGLIVETTLNPRWQELAEKAVDKAISYGRWQRFSQAAIVTLDPRNGQILAMVGGKDFEKNQFNRVTQARRQPGSTFKTFVYATSIAAGNSPYKTFLDGEYFVDGYKPKNYGDKYSYKKITLRSALISSLNVIAVRTLIDVGWQPTIEIAHKMGIKSKLLPTYSLALGSSEVNLLELTNAYGTLANQGIYQPSHGISRVLNSKGQIIYQADFTGQQALDKDTAAIVTWMLRGVVSGGTGTPAQIRRPVAGKTGTSDKSRDLWFIGYIPQAVTGVWLGNDDNRPTWGKSSTAAAIWSYYMSQAVKDLPVESFPRLPNNLSNRSAIVKAEPIKPNRSYYVKESESKKVKSRKKNSSFRRRRIVRAVRRRLTTTPKSSQQKKLRNIKPRHTVRPKPQPKSPILNKPSKSKP